MAQEDPSSFSEWLSIMRQNAPHARERLVQWVRQVRAEPQLLWTTPSARYATYAILIVIGLFAASRLSAAIFVGGESGGPAKTADFHVLCNNPECGYHWVIKKEFGFDDFPVTCPKCKKESGLRAIKCNSKTCHGRWVIVGEDEKGRFCSRCGKSFPSPD